MQGGPIDEDTLLTEPKTDGSARAPLQLMAQFLRAVSESRMENALALAQTILTFEPRNPIMLDYQATLAQYINNERELAEDNSDEGTTSESSSYSEEDDSDTSISEDADSTAESSDDEQKDVNDDDRNVASKTEERPRASSLEETRLVNMLHNLRQARTSRNQESVSRWDEGKFAASRREVEAILWQFLPGEARQAAKNRAKALSVPGDSPKVPPDK